MVDPERVTDEQGGYCGHPSPLAEAADEEAGEDEAGEDEGDEEEADEEEAGEDEAGEDATRLLDEDTDADADAETEDTTPATFTLDVFLQPDPVSDSDFDVAS